MGHERWFRGQHDGQGRPFDWRAAARQHGVPETLARVLYERAVQQARGATQVEGLFLALLADARPDPRRPAPGKVTRTMRLQAQRAGRKRLSSSLSPLTGQPIAPCKSSLTSYIEPAHGRRNETRVSEELMQAAKTASRAFSEPEETPADTATALFEASLAVALDDLDALDADVRELLADEYGIHVAAQGLDDAEEDTAAQPPPEATWTSMEPAFGGRFDDVIVRPDSPEVTGMHAFTRGREIHQDVRIAARTERKSRDHRDHPPAPRAPAMVPDGAGQPMPEPVRAPFEAAMDRSFADVRIHTDAAAAQAAAGLGANAFTVASDIYFGAGQYAPGTSHGDRVLAHELVHVGQRQDGRMASGGGVSVPDDPLEREAYGAEQEIARRAHETRAGAAENLHADQAEPGEPPRATTHPVPSGSSPVHRENANSADQGTGPTVPEQSDEEIFGAADAVVNDEIPVEAAEEGGETGAAAEAGGGAGKAAAESSAGGSEGGAQTPAGPVVEATDGPGPVTVTPTVLAPIQVELAALQPAQMAPSAPPAAPAGQVAGGAVTGSVENARASLHAEVAAAAAGVEGAITAHAAALSAQVQASIDSARSAIDGAFDAQIQAITAAATEVQAQMEAAMADCIAQLEAGHAAQVATAEDDRAARHADADGQVEATRQRMNAMGLREAARARDGSEQRAQQAMALAQASGGGDAACADAQRQAAERIATKTAEEIRAKGESLAEGAIQAANDASTQLDGSADKYHAEIDSSHDSVVEQLGQMLEATIGAVREQGAGPTEQVGNVESAAIEQLERQRQAAHGDLDALAAHVLDTIASGNTGLTESLGAQVDGLLAEIDAEIAAASAALAAVADPVAAQALAMELDASAQQACGEIKATLAEVQTASLAELDGLLEQSDARVAEVVEGATAAADGAGQEAVSRLNEAAGAAVEGLAEVATRGNAELEGLLAEAQAKLDEAKQGLTDDLDTQATAVEDEVIGLVDEGLAEEDQQLAHSASTLQEAMGEIASEYSSLKSQTEGSVDRRVHRGFWSDLASAVSDAASAFANWFMNSFLPWLGGAILGFLVTAIILIVAAVVVAALLAAGPWGWAALAVLAIGMLAMLINRRYDEWVEDLGEPGFWGWCGIVGLAILDITGIVLIFEGLFCQRITGGELDPFDGGWRFGEGLALLMGLALAARAFFKGRGGRGGGRGREGGEGRGREGGEGREGEGREGEGREGEGEGREGEGREGEGREGEGEGREGEGREGEGREGEGREGEGREGEGEGREGEGEGREGEGREGEGREGEGREGEGRESEGEGRESEGEGREGEVAIPRPPRTLAELRSQLSSKGREGFDQAMELNGERAVEGMARRFLREDGTYDVEAADRFFRDRALSAEEYQRRLTNREAGAVKDAQSHIKRIDNTIRETSPEGRPDATIGDGTSEAALLHEATTGEPVGSKGHSLKVRESLQALRDASQWLKTLRPRIRDASVLERIDAAIQRAQAKIDSMEPAERAWSNRVTDHPDVWNADGTSATYTQSDGSPWPPPHYR